LGDGEEVIGDWWLVGLSQKPGLAPGHQKIFSFFNSFKKLQSNFLKELKKENKVSCRRQRVVF
jgi:hypothetical protein